MNRLFLLVPIMILGWQGTSAAQNLFANGTFDKGLTSWTVWGADWDASQNFPLSTSDLGGSAILDTTDLASITQCVKIPADGLYAFSFVAKSRGHYLVSLYMYADNQCEKEIVFSMGLGGQSIDWHQRGEFVYVDGARSALVTAFAESFAAEQTTVWVDDISLMPDKIFTDSFEP